MKESFYRIKVKNAPFYYNGYTTKIISGNYNFHYLVEDKIKWDNERFWACSLKSTLLRHLYLIHRLTGLSVYKELLVEKCTIGRIEHIDIKELGL